jgi:hypothetical protein
LETDVEETVEMAVLVVEAELSDEFRSLKRHSLFE